MHYKDDIYQMSSALRSTYLTLQIFSSLRLVTFSRSTVSVWSFSLWQSSK